MIIAANAIAQQASVPGSGATSKASSAVMTPEPAKPPMLNWA